MMISANRLIRYSNRKTIRTELQKCSTFSNRSRSQLKIGRVCQNQFQLTSTERKSYHSFSSNLHKDSSIITTYQNASKVKVITGKYKGRNLPHRLISYNDGSSSSNMECLQHEIYVKPEFSESEDSMKNDDVSNPQLLPVLRKRISDTRIRNDMMKYNISDQFTSSQNRRKYHHENVEDIVKSDNQVQARKNLYLLQKLINKNIIMYQKRSRMHKLATFSTKTPKTTKTTKEPIDEEEDVSKSSGNSKTSSSENIKFNYEKYRNIPTTNSSQYEYNNYIELLQRNRAQALRAKTTLNVQRALYGNCIIAITKLGAWISSGSSAMLSEFIHSLVDCGNQSLLLIGLRDSAFVADRKHPYGYGKSMYFWALVSALGTFWLGAGISMRHSIEELMHPSVNEITWHVWGVLGTSLAVDGWVLYRTISGIQDTKPAHLSFYKHVSNLRDPATLAVLLEDGAACLGIVMASAGIALTAATGSPIYDGLAGIGISALLASIGLILVRINQRFLLGQAVDQETIAGIEKILLSRKSIDSVHSVQSQWTGPETFSYKAEVDFDGTYLAAKLMPRYQKEFMKAKETLNEDLNVMLSWYAEDIMRAVEREIRHIEAEIRREYPGAAFIELEPDSKDADRFAIDDGMETTLRDIERKGLNRMLKKLYVDNGVIIDENESTADATKESLKKAKPIQIRKAQDDNEKEYK